MIEAEARLYKRATFVTQLPTTHLFTPSHCWLARAAETGRWRVGFTKFALRMLGELVDVQFEKQHGAPVAAGEVIGAIEGFKALSDIYCVGTGSFCGPNPVLREGMDRIWRDPYHGGWLYEFDGEPDTRCLDVNGYESLLNETIDRILAKQKSDETVA